MLSGPHTPASERTSPGAAACSPRPAGLCCLVQKHGQKHRRCCLMVVTVNPPDTRGRSADRYARLEERILARDQQGAADCFFDLASDRPPLTELLLEPVPIHAP